MSGGIAAAIPERDVPAVSVFFKQAATPVGPRGAIGVSVGEHVILVHPPKGYRVMQVAEGEPSHAHVTLAPFATEGGPIVLRFEVPSGLDHGDAVDERDGLPVFETRFGLWWEAADGFELLVAGSGVDRGVLLEVLQTTEVM